MQRRFVQALVGLIMVAVLVLGPIGPGALGRRAGQAQVPEPSLAIRGIFGWDDGGSSGC